jgi:hypothetical protein
MLSRVTTLFPALAACLVSLWAAPALHATVVYITYTGGAADFIVPPNVYSLQVELWGAGGGSTGASGGYVTALLSVNPNEDLTVNIAGGGHSVPGEAAALGGFGGGGVGSGADFSTGPGWGGSGGGATSILSGSTLLLDAAGGGGGGAGGLAFGSPGGAGGGLIGADGIGIPGGGGATQTAGGVNLGFPSWPCVNCNGSLGLGGTGDVWEGGGGGGGGYYGGAGGAAGLGAAVGGSVGGGGGGSSYIGGPGVSNASTLSGSNGTNSGVLPANTSDPNYQSGVGTGGAYAAWGGNGLAALSFTAIPEPSTGATMLGALLIFGFCCKKRRILS